MAKRKSKAYLKQIRAAKRKAREASAQRYKERQNIKTALYQSTRPRIQIPETSIDRDLLVANIEQRFDTVTKEAVTYFASTSTADIKIISQLKNFINYIEELIINIILYESEDKVKNIEGNINDIIKTCEEWIYRYTNESTGAFFNEAYQDELLAEVNDLMI